MSRLGNGRLQDIRSLRPLCPLHDLKLDVFSFFQTLESFSLQCRIMYEDIVSALKTNEPKSLAIIEPLDRTFRLHRNPLSSTATPSYVAGSGTQLATHRMNRNQQEEEQVETTGSLERQNRPQSPSRVEHAQHVPWHFKSCQAILWPAACREWMEVRWTTPARSPINRVTLRERRDFSNVSTNAAGSLYLHGTPVSL